MSERCEIRRCRAEASITYLDHGVCERHWNQLTAEDAPPEALRIALGIEATAPTALEDTTMEPTPGKPANANAPTAAPGKAVKQTKKQAAKDPKPKKEKVPKPPLVVFAFRLTTDERDRIHKAAGPANASRFVKTAALAAAGGDRAAFEELVAIGKASKK